MGILTIGSWIVIGILTWKIHSNESRIFELEDSVKDLKRMHLRMDDA